MGRALRSFVAISLIAMSHFVGLYTTHDPQLSTHTIHQFTDINNPSNCTFETQAIEDQIKIWRSADDAQFQTWNYVRGIVFASVIELHAIMLSLPVPRGECLKQMIDDFPDLPDGVTGRWYVDTKDRSPIIHHSKFTDRILQGLIWVIHHCPIEKAIELMGPWAELFMKSIPHKDSSDHLYQLQMSQVSVTLNVNTRSRKVKIRNPSEPWKYKSIADIQLWSKIERQLNGCKPTDSKQV